MATIFSYTFKVIYALFVGIMTLRTFHRHYFLVSFILVPIVGTFPNRVTIRRLELGTEYIKTIPCFDNSVLTIMYLVLDVNYLLTVVKLIDTL